MRKFTITFLILFVIAFTSCEDVIQVDLNNENINLLVVEAQISTIDAPFCRISKAEQVTSENPLEKVSGANVIIENVNDNSDFVNLMEIYPGFYSITSTAYAAKNNAVYRITISIDDYTITGIDSLAEVSKIDSIQVRPSEVSTPLFLSVYNFGKESPTPNQYYKWEVIVNDSVINNISNINYASDELINGNNFEAIEVFTDFHDPMMPEERILGFGDTISLRQSSISSFVYDYYIQLSNQGNTGSLFSVPPANIKGNLHASNNRIILGYFSAHDVSISESIIINDSIENLLTKL